MTYHITGGIAATHDPAAGQGDAATSAKCPQCEQHEHVCGGCGDHLPHGSYACAACRDEFSK